jgi:hypothetical protein
MTLREKTLILCSFQPSLSLPGSPFPPHRTSRRRSSQFSWRKPPPVSPRATAAVNGNGGIGASMDGSCGGRPMVIPCLDNLELPYADDSAAVTPTSEDLCNFYNAHYFIGANYGSAIPNSSYSFIQNNGPRPNKERVAKRTDQKMPLWQIFFENTSKLYSSTVKLSSLNPQSMVFYVTSCLEVSLCVESTLNNT